MSIFDAEIFYTANMNIDRAKELIEQMNTNREIVAHALTGMGDYNYALCKIFLGKENLSVYCLNPELKLLYEVPNADVKDVRLYPMEETIEIPNTKSTLGRGILGFIIGDWAGAALGMLTTVFPEYKTIDVYNLKIETTHKTLCFQVKE